MPARAFLSAYANRLSAVEVNYTFNKLPTNELVRRWLVQTPDHFRFAFKAPQRLTHFQRLAGSEETLKAFLDSLAPAADAKRLGPVFFQLPPNFKFNAERLSTFLALPQLARGHQVCFEFRHKSWFCEETYDILRARNAALCVADTDDLKTPDIATADFYSYRLRRDGGYKPAELKQFASNFVELASRGDVYVFYRHQEQPTGALNAAATLAYAAKLISGQGART